MFLLPLTSRQFLQHTKSSNFKSVYSIHRFNVKVYQGKPHCYLIPQSPQPWIFRNSQEMTLTLALFFSSLRKPVPHCFYFKTGTFALHLNIAHRRHDILNYLFVNSQSIVVTSYVEGRKKNNMGGKKVQLSRALRHINQCGFSYQHD